MGRPNSQPREAATGKERPEIDYQFQRYSETARVFQKVDYAVL
jgi:hypothetical protein